MSETFPFDSAAVIGLGLIGGAVVRDLAARGVRVSAYDRDPVQLEAARSDGVVSRALDASLRGLGEVQLVVIAVPVDAALDVLRLVAAQVCAAGSRTLLVTDVGSTKGRIESLAVELGLAQRFIGSHPMAGDHRSGWSASRAGLFAGAPLYLCAPPGAAAPTLGLARRLWSELGASLVEIDAREHDLRVAWTSHLPHMVAATLGLALARGGFRRDDLGPGGRDMTRIAGSSPEMWTAIGIDNAAAIDETLAAAEAELARFRDALRRSDAGRLRERFIAARAWFDQ
jgi:prephenate dehydrogenase